MGGVSEGTIKAGKGSCSVFGTALAIFFIVIGVIHGDDCPGAPKLGFTLIVLGSLTLATSILGVCATVYGGGYDEMPDSAGGFGKCIILLLGLAGLANFGFFIYLCIIVYGLNDVVDYEDPTNQYYCDKLLFLSTFWVLTISFGFILLLFSIAILVGCCMCCSRS